MPPKAAPGRGGTRGRGRGRGGSAAGRTAAAAPPEGEIDDSKPPVANMTEPQVSAEAATESSTAEPASRSSTRAPVQRLESLRSTEPVSSAPAPPARRTPSTRGKKPAVAKPVFTGRRSKDERAALAKDLSQREKQRADEAEKVAKRKPQPRKEMPRNDKGSGGPIGGPFSGGSVPKDRRSTSQITSFGSRATRIKREDGDDWGGSSGRSGRGGGGGGGGGGSGGPEDDAEYVSSGDEDGDDIPRKDIDAIYISSDEERGAASAARPRRQLQEMLLPVRIGREEHKERVIGINTEASSEDAAKILKQAEATGGEIKAEPGLVGKGKNKAKEVEVVGRPFKGMWQDSDESDAQVKAEPEAENEDENMEDAVPMGNSETAPMDLTTTTPDGEPSVEATEEGDTQVKAEHKKPRTRGKKAEPVLQTDEEKAEHQRFVDFTKAVRLELGGASEEAHGDPREESSYLFQLPPIMPKARLADTTIKEEMNPTPTPAPGAKAGRPKPVDKKVERKRKEYAVAPGLVGRLRVHESGRVSLRWGSETFELMPANPATFEQEVVEIENVPVEKRVVPEEGGDGTSFGRVKGKFVAIPNWKAMLS